MDWQTLQTVLTSETAMIIYELILMILFLVLIVRMRKKNKMLAEQIESSEKRRQREGLDSQLSNKNRR